ncbi:hypothetical protein SGL43_05354 [Streptomyces globisporus]|uniref:Uncharacterized protein n=1 Tax=Streptomyces globisporus TaxID=1908 RepID=A0ABM9H3U8_STRGL|nr:hypothetical protein SGL43_05354 [Streptomyces globisporus]
MLRPPRSDGHDGDVVLRDPLVAGDGGHSLGPSPGGQYPIQGIAVQGRQPACPAPRVPP